jgi:hypothetical protein
MRARATQEVPECVAQAKRDWKAATGTVERKQAWKVWWRERRKWRDKMWEEKTSKEPKGLNGSTPIYVNLEGSKRIADRSEWEKGLKKFIDCFR